MMHHIESDKLIACLNGGPAQTIDKIEAAVEDSQAAWAAWSAANESARELHRIWVSSEAARLSHHRGDWTREGATGAPVYTATTRDKGWIEPIAEQLRRDWRAWNRAKASAERLEAAWHTHAYLFDVLAWRTDLGRGVPLTRHDPPAPKLAKSQGHADAVAEIRERLARVWDRTRFVENAPATAEELIERQNAAVDSASATGVVSANLAARLDAAFDIEGRFRVEALGRGEVGIRPATLAWIFADEIKEKLAAKIRAAHDGGGISDFDRAAELSALGKDALALERLEEAHIVAAAATGQTIPRRREASPYAILEIGHPTYD